MTNEFANQLKQRRLSTSSAVSREALKMFDELVAAGRILDARKLVGLDIEALVSQPPALGTSDPNELADWLVSTGLIPGVHWSRKSGGWVGTDSQSLRATIKSHMTKSAAQLQNQFPALADEIRSTPPARIEMALRPILAREV